MAIPIVRSRKSTIQPLKVSKIEPYPEHYRFSIPFPYILLDKLEIYLNTYTSTLFIRGIIIEYMDEFISLNKIGKVKWFLVQLPEDMSWDDDPKINPISYEFTKFGDILNVFLLKEFML